MNFSKSIRLIACLLFVFQSNAYGFTDFNRCSHVNADNTTFAGPSYDGSQAETVRRWTARCYPDWREDLRDNPYLIATLDSGAKQKRTAYPVFGVKTFVPDPNDPFGLKGNTIYSNPANYYPPAPSAQAVNGANATETENLITQAATTMSCNLPDSYTIVGWCGAGCYAADQKVLFPEGYVEIGEAAKENFTHVISLKQGATLDNLSYQVIEMDGFTQDFNKKLQTVLHFKMESGGKLVVTKNHPLVDQKGHMREASDLKVGESLVTENGELDKISSINEEMYFGRVYNVTVKSSDKTENIVVAQGYLNGSFLYQNDYAAYLNQKLLRDDLIPDEVVL